MPEFLELLSPNDAINKLVEQLDFSGNQTEILNTDKGLDRVLARDFFSSEDIPAFTRSTVDGFAVNSKDTFGASEVLPAFFEVVGEILMGRPASVTLKKGQACLIHTGGMLPEGADAVVMVENTQTSTSNEIEVYKAIPAGENIILKGEDIKNGSIVLKKGTRLRPAEIAALMALGIIEIEVYSLPKVGILSTGDEIIPPWSVPELGQIRDINSYSLSTIIEKLGGIPSIYPIVKDNKQQLFDSLKKAFEENDLVIVTAGSSASVRDLTSEVINDLGNPGVIVHGVNIKPGKPTIFAVIDGKPIIGLPGNPVSAFVIAHLVLKTIMPLMRGEENHNFLNQMMKGIITINVPSMAGREDWVPVKFMNRYEKGYPLVEPIFYKSNLIFSLLSAAGLARIEPNKTGLEAFSEVEILLI